MTKKKAKELLGLNDMSDSDFWRVLRCDHATPQEVERVEKAIKSYGQRYNLPGWQEL